MTTTTTATAADVANTIWNQLARQERAGAGMLAMMLNARNFYHCEKDGDVVASFRFSGSQKANCLRVTYRAGRDLYRFELLKLGRTSLSVVLDLEDVYAEDLARIFTDQTGLLTSMF